MMIWNIVLATMLFLCVGCAAWLVRKIKKTKQQLEAVKEKLDASEASRRNMTKEIDGLRVELEIEKKIPKMRPFERVVIEQKTVNPVELRAKLIVPDILPAEAAEDELLYSLKDEIKKYWTIKRSYQTWDVEISASLWVVPNWREHT